MQNLLAFTSISLDGYFADANGDMSWAYNPKKDDEWDAFVASNASGGGLLVFGRITYDLMRSYWPTPAAIQQYPVVAERMNSFPKVVFSRTLASASWSNTRILKEGLAGEIRKMKESSGRGMAILGSGSIVSQLTQERLIDEYQFVVTPVVLGKGRTMFEGVTERFRLELKSTRAFKNGNVVLCYTPRA